MPHTTPSLPDDVPLGRLIHLVNQHKDRLLTQSLAPLDITAAQFKVLVSIHFEYCQTPAEISKLLSIDGGSMTRMLARLEKKALIERHPAPDDKRKVLLRLSPEGQKICDSSKQLATAGVHGALTANLSEQEVHTLKSLLIRMLPDDAVLCHS